MPGFNPYLPWWENVPDGEPHLFDGRVYIYGSHDDPQAGAFCIRDYVCWSAPEEDLTDWRYEGVIYTKKQDPINGAPYDKKIPEYDMAFSGGDDHLLYAPDVTQGPDGRYYLYYALDFTNLISVAVCDTPAGKYEFLDYVTRSDGTRPNIGRWFDPAILSEESGNYMYYGFAPTFRFPGMEDLEIPGGMVVQLADDMHTIISEATCTANGCDTCKGTDYEAHPFFEASSIRHYGDWYYFVYSSLQGHELCYGMSKTPTGPFAYKGILHSNADLGVNDNEYPVMYFGNNHGGLVKVGDDYYIFGHRHTRGTSFARQGVAEKITMNPDGTFNQAELTSCGLNGGPLPAKGTYPTYIACHLTEADRSKVGHTIEPGPGGGSLVLPETMPYMTDEPCEIADHGVMPFIKNMQTGTTCGFKYFDFDGTESEVSVKVRGLGKLGIALDDSDASPISISAGETADGWYQQKIHISGITGVHAVYFTVTEGTLDFAEFEVK